MDSPIILSEVDYLGQSSEPYSWGNVIQIATYCSHSALFVGLSMVDPHLRSLLRSTSEANRYPHFAMLPSEASGSHAAQAAEGLFDRDLVDLHVKAIRYPVNDGPDRHGRLWSLMQLLADSLQDEGILWA